MANAIDTGSNLHVLDTSDIISRRAIWVRKVQMKATAKGDEAHFYTLPASKAADHDHKFTNLTFNANTYTITDAASGGLWTAHAANDWVHITDCSIAANDGWWYLETATDANNFDIEHTSAINGTAHALTAGTGASARIRIYTPIECMMIVGDTTEAAAASIHHPIVDWGDKGRWFPHGLSMSTADTIDINLYI